MSIAEKFYKILDTKGKIKQAIIDKGVEVPDDTTFEEYADKIQSIEVSKNEWIIYDVSHSRGTTAWLPAVGIPNNFNTAYLQKTGDGTFKALKSFTFKGWISTRGCWNSGAYANHIYGRLTLNGTQVAFVESADRSYITSPFSFEVKENDVIVFQVKDDGDRTGNSVSLGGYAG